MSRFIFILLLIMVMSSNSSSSSSSSKCPCWKAKDIIKSCKKELGLSGSFDSSDTTPNQCYLSANELINFGFDGTGFTLHCGMTYYQLSYDFDGGLYTCTSSINDKKDEVCTTSERSAVHEDEELDVCFYEILEAMDELNCVFDHCDYFGERCPTSDGCDLGLCLTDAASRSFGCASVDPYLFYCEGPCYLYYEMPPCYTDNQCPDDEICWFGMDAVCYHSDHGVLTIDDREREGCHVTEEKQDLQQRDHGFIVSHGICFPRCPIPEEAPGVFSSGASYQDIIRNIKQGSGGRGHDDDRVNLHKKAKISGAKDKDVGVHNKYDHRNLVISLGPSTTILLLSMIIIVIIISIFVYYSPSCFKQKTNEYV